MRYTDDMQKQHVLAILRANAVALQAIGAEHLTLFGSVARDEAGEASDIDLIITGSPEQPVTLFTMARVQSALEQLLSRQIHLLPAKGLKRSPEMQARIAADLTAVF
jgi:predicted nucleotidyltransferase